MIVLSLGWGIQSFTLAAMSALGELPRLDVAIHADTGHERSATYEFAAKWTPWLEGRGVRVVTVYPHEKYAESVNQFGGVQLPAFTGTGQFKRQCTTNWKIQPIRRYLKANAKFSQMWIGITLDEAHRAKPADVRYIEHAWPFLGIGVDAPGGRPWSRRDVINWLTAHGIEVPPRSACVFCPFQSSHEWQRVSENPQDWLNAVEADRRIRNARPPGQLFVHKSLRPLEELDFNQHVLDLWGNECSGLCGV